MFAAITWVTLLIALGTGPGSVVPVATASPPLSPSPNATDAPAPGSPVRGDQQSKKSNGGPGDVPADHTLALAVQRRDLASGIRVVLVRDSGAPVVAVRASWSGGLRLESAAHAGIGQLLALALAERCNRAQASSSPYRGPYNHPDDAPSWDVRVSSGRDALTIWAEWPVSRWRQGLGQLLSCLAPRQFAAQAFERHRQHLLVLLRQRAAQPGASAWHAFVQALYQHGPYAVDSASIAASVRTLSRQQMQAFFRRHYPLSALRLAIVGDVDAHTALDNVDVISRRITGPSTTTTDTATVTAQTKRADLGPDRAAAVSTRPSVEKQNHTQVYHRLEHGPSHMIVGVRGAAWRSEDRVALTVLAAVLGHEGGRLRAMMEARGIPCHVADVASVTGVERGHWFVRLVCQAPHSGAAWTAVRDAWRQLGQRALPEAEVQRIKGTLTRAHRQHIRRPGALAAALAFHETFVGGYEHALSYASDIAAVDAEALRRVAARYLVWNAAVTATAKPLSISPDAERRMRGVKRRPSRRSRK